ncbi:MAG: DNA-directed RNA polymerase subunit alpha C-terminal domain-containing protein [Minicystis sp.]
MVSAGGDGPKEEDLSIDVLPLPARMRNWARAHGIDTLGDLARIPPHELMAQRYLGHLTIDRTREVIESYLGVPWEEVSPSRPPGDVAAEGRPPKRASKKYLLAPGEDVSLDHVPLPTRMRNWADRQGIETLRALARIPPEDLRGERNLGRTSIRETRTLINAYLGIPWTRERPQPSAEQGVDQAAEQAALAKVQHERRQEALLRASFLDGLRMAVAELPKNERAVLESCTGLVGPARSRKELARRFGVLEPAIYRWRRVGAGRLRDEAGWLAAVRERASQALPDGAVLLETLAADPWWAGIAALPETLDFFAGQLLDLHVIEVEGRRYLARVRQNAFDDAWEEVRAKCAGVRLPAPRSAFRALLDPWAQRFGPVLVALLWDRLDALLTLDPAAPGTGDDPRVVRFGISQPEQARLFLQAAPEPVTTAG